MAILLRVILMCSVAMLAVAVGHLWVLPEVVTSGAVIVAVITFSWFQERVVARMAPGLSAPLGLRNGRTR